MILFPNAKLNLGLRILGKRPDGFHDILSVFIPTEWCDILELVPANGKESSLTLSGNDLSDCPPEKNLVFKALRAIEGYMGMNLPTDIFLRKVIPDGAGLGGGSSDAAFTIKGLNELYHLDLTDEKMAEIASEIGSDCPFFIYNRPMIAAGRGTELSPISINFQGCHAILIAKPEGVSVSTRDAYSGVHPYALSPEENMREILSLPPSMWESRGLRNDFEKSVFPLHPEISHLKSILQSFSPLYCSMSGSGASVFAIFESMSQAEVAQRNISGRSFLYAI